MSITATFSNHIIPDIENPLSGFVNCIKSGGLSYFIIEGSFPVNSGIERTKEYRNFYDSLVLLKEKINKMNSPKS